MTLLKFARRQPLDAVLTVARQAMRDEDHVLGVEGGHYFIRLRDLEAVFAERLVSLVVKSLLNRLEQLQHLGGSISQRQCAFLARFAPRPAENVLGRIFGTELNTDRNALHLPAIAVISRIRFFSPTTNKRSL